MSLRQDRANAIRALSMDAVQKTKSGHPGAPMGMADIAKVLWDDNGISIDGQGLSASVTKRVAIEATHVDYWAKYIGIGGDIVGMSTFGKSAQGAEL
jgi:transketolase